MPDPTLSDIDFKNKMAWVGTTLKNVKKNKIFIKRDAWKYENLDPWLRSVTK